MRAQRIIQASAFGPEDVARLQAAFDMAWKQIGPTVDTAQHPAAREALAIIVVSAGRVSELDAEELAAFAQRTYASISAANRAS